MAFGNLLQGVPFQFDAFMVSTYTGTFWQLLDPFALLCGVLSSAMITMHGGIYLAHRTEGEVQRRARRAAAWAALVAVLAFLAAGAWLRWGGIDGYAITSAIDPAAPSNPMAKTVARSAGAWWANYGKVPALWLLPALGVAGALAGAALSGAGRTLLAFVASALSLAGIIGTAGAAMFPFVMPSSSLPQAAWLIWDCVSSHFTLGLMFWVALIFVPIVVSYTGWAYRVMRGKVTAEHIRANEHSAY